MISPQVLWTLLRKPDWWNAWRRTTAHWQQDIAYRPGANDITRTADAAHPCESPFYFEWWYFDVSLPDDSALAFIFHLTDLIKPAAPTSSLNVSFFRPGKPTQARFIQYPRREIKASLSECDVRMGKNRCWVDPDGNYHVLIDEPEVKAEIAFESLLSGWQPGDGKIQFGSPGRFFAWVVPQPRANVAGWVQLGNERCQVDGTGYHDHNWGTVSLIETLNAWSWGRVYMDDYTLVYADMCLSPRYTPSRPMPFLLVHREHGSLASFLHKSIPLDASGWTSPPEGWELFWQGAEGSFNLTLKTKHVLEEADLLQNHSPLVKNIIGGLIAHPRYLRCVTEADGNFELWGKAQTAQGKAIVERMVLRVPARVYLGQAERC